MTKPDVVLIAYGEGGHHAQARRLATHISPAWNLTNGGVYSLTDKPGIALPGSREIVFSPFGDKRFSAWALIVLLTPLALVTNLLQAWQVLRICLFAHRIVFVSLGPSFTFIPALVVRAAGGTVIHIETWSRFSSYSFCGRILHYIAHHFLVQNEELLRLYPRGVYCGRL